VNKGLIRGEAAVGIFKGNKLSGGKSGVELVKDLIRHHSSRFPPLLLPSP